MHRVTSANKKSATFSLDAPGEVEVAVGGSFNNWEPQAMTRGQDGVWRITLQLASGTHQYRFLVGSQWREDPHNPRKVQNDQGGFNSVCSVM
jgi:1,4-alpha-glucan branching enzyme